MNDSSANAPATRDACSEKLAALLRSAAAGDGRAFEEFYAATSRAALAATRRITGEAHAEDVLADAYFQAWRSAAQFDSARGSPMAWLLTIARSRALDRMRQEALRHGGLAGAPEFDADAQPQLPGASPDDLLEGVETSTRLHEALRALSANERWVLGLAYFRDTSQSEIATMTGMPLGTVKSLMSRAQHKLRRALDHDSP